MLMHLVFILVVSGKKLNAYSMRDVLRMRMARSKIHDANALNAGTAKKFPSILSDLLP